VNSTRQRNFGRAFTAALSAAALSLFLSPATVAAQGFGLTSSYTGPVPSVTVGTCDGYRQITLSGEVHYVVRFASSASGNRNFGYQINYQKVKGVDQFGNEYVVSTTNSDSAVYDEDSQRSATLVQYFRLIGKGQASNQMVRNVSHLTLNANDELTVIFYTFDADCK